MTNRELTKELVQRLLGSQEGEAGDEHTTTGDVSPLMEEGDWGDCFLNPNRACNASCMAFSLPTEADHKSASALGTAWMRGDDTPCAILRDLASSYAAKRETAVYGQHLSSEVTRLSDIMLDVRDQMVQMASKQR